MMKKTCQNSWKRVCSLTLCAALVLGSVHPLTAEVYIGEEDMQENINAFDDIILAEDAEDEGGSLIEGLPEDEEMTPDEDLLPGEEELTDEEGFIEEEVIPMAGSGQAASGGEEGGGIIIEEPGEENEEPTVFVEDEIYAVGTVAGSSYIGSWHREELLVKVERSTGIITAVEQKDDISSIWLPSKLRREDGEDITLTGVAEDAFIGQQLYSLFIPVTISAENFSIDAFGEGSAGSGGGGGGGIVVSKSAASKGSSGSVSTAVIPYFYGAPDEAWTQKAEQFGTGYCPLVIDEVTPCSSGTIGGSTAEIIIRQNETWETDLYVTLTGRNGEGKYEYVSETGSMQLHYQCVRLGLDLDSLNVPDGNYDIEISNEDYGIEWTGWYYVDRAAPGALQGLTAQQEGSSVLITWDAGSEADIQFYHVRITDGETGETHEELVYPDMTSYLFEENIPGHTYTISIVAEDTFYQVGEASEVTFTAREDSTPPVIRTDLPDTGEVPAVGGVYSFYAYAEDDKGIDLEGYVLQYLDEADEDDQWRDLQIPPVPGYYGSVTFEADFAEDTFFEGMESITLRLQVTDRYGNTAYGGEHTYLIDRTGPEKVTGLRQDNSEYPSSVVILNWNEVGDEDFMRFSLEERTETDNGEMQWAEVRSIYGQRGVRLFGLKPGSTHTYRVCAYDSFENRGTCSDELTVTLAEDTKAPVVTWIYPYDGQAFGTSEANIYLSFTVTDDSDVCSLRVQTSTDEGEEKSWTDAGTVTFEGMSSGDTERHEWSVSYTLSLEGFPDGPLYVRGVAADASGNADESGNVLFMSYTIDRNFPLPPAGLTAAWQDGAVTLSWDRGEDTPAFFCVRRTGDYSWSDIEWNIGVPSEENDRYTWTDDGSSLRLLCGHTYTYYVRACDAAGNEGNEASVTITTGEDTRRPAVTGFYPDEADYRITQSRSISIECSDNDQLSVLYARCSTDGGQTWSEPVTNNLLEYSETGPDTYSWYLLPGDTFSLADDVTELEVEAWCEDAAGNVSDIKRASWTADLSGPAIEGYGLSLQEGYPVLEWDNADDIAWWEILRKRSGSVETRVCGCYGYEENEVFDIQDGHYRWTDLSVSENYRYEYVLCAQDRDGNKTRTLPAGAYIRRGSLTDTSAPEAVISCNLVGQAGVEMAFSGERSTDDRRVQSWEWTFSDGYTSDQSVARHAFAEAGTYTVTLTVRDKAGNEGTAEKEVTVTEKGKSGTVTVTVRKKGGGALKNAGVYFRLGSEDMTVLYTDQNGHAALEAPEGSYLVGVYADGFLPVSRDIHFVNRAHLEAVIELEEKELVTGSLTVKKMTLEEIKAAGIDVTDPANHNIVDFTIGLTYQGYPHKIHTFMRSNGTYAGGGTASFGGRNYYVVPLSGSGGFSWADHSSQLGSEPPYALIDVPGKASWLKDFFDVNLTVVNNAPEPFSLDNASALLKVPDGLTLVDSDRTDAESLFRMGSIPGGQSASATWILRGDEPGSYELEAVFNATLHSFNEPITAVFKSGENVVVSNGENIYIDVLTERETAVGEPPVLRVGIRTEGEDTLNCPHISLEKASLVRSFVTEGDEVIAHRTEVLTKGQELWADYVITQESFAALQAYRESFEGQFSSHLTGQVLKDAFNLDLSGMEVNFTFDTVEDHMIAATRIEIFKADGSGLIEDTPITEWVYDKDAAGNDITTLIGQQLPSFLIHTSFPAPNGEMVSGPTPLFIRDDYLTAEDDVYGERILKEAMTDEYGDYLFSGYPIEHSAWVQTSPLGNGQALADELEVTRYESDTYYEISFASWRDETEFSVSVKEKAHGSLYPKLDDLTFFCMAKMAYKDMDCDAVRRIYQIGPDAPPLDEQLIEAICNEPDEAGTETDGNGNSRYTFNQIQYCSSVRVSDKDLHWSDVMKQCLTGWSIVDYVRNNTTGFFAIVFSNGLDVVIAYRGSDNLDLSKNANDWIYNDAVMALVGVYTSQMKEALLYANRIRRKYGPIQYNLYATGHSLGGGLGILAANALNIKARCFDSAPTLRAGYFSLIGAMGASFRGIDKWTYTCISEEQCPVGAIERNSKNYILLQSGLPTVETNVFFHHSPDAMLFYDKDKDEFRMMPKKSSNTFLPGGAWRYDMDFMQLSEILDNWKKELDKDVGGALIDNFIGSDQWLLNGLAKAVLGWFEISDRISAEFRKIPLQLGTSGNNVLHGATRLHENLGWFDYPNVIYGGDGNDTLKGGYYEDFLTGGRGDDRLDGGSGNDNYLYIKNDGHDTIIDVCGDDTLVMKGFASGDKIAFHRYSSEIAITCNGKEIITVNPRRGIFGITQGTLVVRVLDEKGNLVMTETIKDWNKDLDRSITVACPVDVQVYGPDGSLVYTIRDGQELTAYEEFGMLYAAKADGSDEYIKELCLMPGYTVKMVGRGTGTMYVAVTCAGDDASGARTYAAKQIPVEEGAVYALDDQNLKIREESGAETPRTFTMAEREDPFAHRHAWSEWKQVSPATVFAREKQVRTCTKNGCGEKEYREVGSKLAPVLQTNASSLVLKKKQSFKGFKVTMARGDCVSSWTSKNRKILKVTGRPDGTCTLKAGKVTGKTKLVITLKSGKSVTISVKVQKKPVATKSISGLPGTLTLKKGAKETLHPQLLPITSTDKIKYTSSDKKKLAVSRKGVLTARKKGTVRVTVRAGKKKRVIRVTVRE